jgi:hypothetical protein
MISEIIRKQEFMVESENIWLGWKYSSKDIAVHVSSRPLTNRIVIHVVSESGLTAASDSWEESFHARRDQYKENGSKEQYYVMPYGISKELLHNFLLELAKRLNLKPRVFR